jgi:hypothetical protein
MRKTTTAARAAAPAAVQSAMWIPSMDAVSAFAAAPK